jgi:hypothetical protein
MAEKHHEAYVRTSRDAFAHHVTRLAGDDVQLADRFAAEWPSLAH